MVERELLVYQTANGQSPFTEWLASLKDRQARSRIEARINRLALGNPGDHRMLDSGLFELRIDWGPGYRVYCARMGDVIVLLLCGGDKTAQQKDIANAKACLQDFKSRS
jgi:putative addiction module killer protein